MKKVATDIIYKQLFGCTQLEMIRQAKTRSDAWNFMHHSSDDQAMRDCLSIESLKALSSIESECFRLINNISKSVSYNDGYIVSVMRIVKHVVSQYEPVQMVWDD